MCQVPVATGFASLRFEIRKLQMVEIEEKTAKVSKLQGGDTMESSETVMTEGKDAEEEYVLQLKALLHDLVRNKGRIRAAEELGLDPRTVGACMDGDGMSWRVREALERGLQEGAGSAAARQRKRNDALERRLGKLEKELHDSRDAVMGEVGKLREDQDQKWESFERQLARMETSQENRQESSRPAEAPSATGQAPEKAPAAAKPKVKARFPKRLYPELVTREPAPDDEEVFGEAWPLIQEWREIWKAGHVGTGKGLAWLETEERVRELEVAMLEEHGLTLPPETMPLTGLWRSAQLNWRRKTLHEVRRAVAWRHLLRIILTCGLWRSRWWRGRA